MAKTSIKRQENTLKGLQAGFSYFRNYSHILEREIEKDKKNEK